MILSGQGSSGFGVSVLEGGYIHSIASSSLSKCKVGIALSLPQNFGMHIIYLQLHSKVRQLYCPDLIELTTEVRQIGSYK